MMNSDATNSPGYLIGFIDAFNRFDARALATYYTQDAVLDYGGGQIVTGPTEIRRALTTFLAMHVPIEIDKFWELISGDVAVVSLDWQVTGFAAQGNFVKMGGRALHVLVRGPDDRWLIKIDKPFSNQQ